MCRASVYGRGCSPAAGRLWMCRQWSGATSAGSTPQASTASIARRTSLTLGQPSMRRKSRRRDVERQGRKDSPGVTARAMSILETTVPKSLAAQRTKAKTAPGAKLTTRRRRLTIVSSAMRPKRIQCSIRFSSQVSSTRDQITPAVLSSAVSRRARPHCAPPSCSGIRTRAPRAACRRRSVRAERRRP